MNQAATLSIQTTQTAYDPNLLLDTLMRHLGIDSDSALSRRLKVARKIISNIRKGTLPVCASMLLWMHEATGISIDELRRIMGDRRRKSRLSFAKVPSYNPVVN
jgi:transcriptional regulator with XRE-family HTH domain